MKECNLPTRKECFEIIEEFHVPSHIRRHSLSVAKLAVFLAEKLKEKGIRVDVELLDRACLLHDIARVCDFKEPDCGKFDQPVTEQDKAKWAQVRSKYGGIGHEEAAYDILREKYPTLALTIRKHRYMAMLDEKTKPYTWEEKLIYYADMRVMEDKIVPLKERLEDCHRRNIHLHGTEVQSRINTARVDPLIYRMEAEIFDKLDLRPIDVTDEFIDSHTDGRHSKK